VERAVVMRAAIANRRGEQLLRRLGVKIVRPAHPVSRTVERLRRAPESEPRGDADAVA
jgi:hypothetical protein